MPMLERDEALARLEAGGRVAVVAGEAGIGKLRVNSRADAVAKVSSPAWP